jgi:hypothetical protein
MSLSAQMMNDVPGIRTTTKSGDDIVNQPPPTTRHPRNAVTTTRPTGPKVVSDACHRERFDVTLGASTKSPRWMGALGVNSRTGS